MSTDVLRIMERHHNLRVFRGDVMADNYLGNRMDLIDRFENIWNAFSLDLGAHVLYLTL